MSDQTLKRNYSSVLWEEMRTFSFICLAVYCVLNLLQRNWAAFDGVVFHFQNFFIGEVNNRNDFTRWVAIVMTDLPDLIYTNLGGTNFAISAALYNFGNTIHVFYPFLLLVYLKYRYPGHDSWIKLSQLYYVLSLILLKGVCYLFTITELNMGHTMTWMVIFAFRMRSLLNESDEFLDNFLWTTAILGIMVYPLVLFTYGYFIISQTLPGVDSVRNGKKDWRIFFGILIVIEIGFYFYYSYLHGDAGSIRDAIRAFPTNRTAHLQIFVLVTLLLLKPFFRWQFFCLAGLALLGRLAYSSSFSPWDHYMGRVVGLGFTIAAQAVYVFIIPRLNPEKTFQELKPRMIPMAALQLIICFMAGQQLIDYHNSLLSILEKEKRLMTFEEVKNALPIQYRQYTNSWNARTLSISLQLLKGSPIESVVQKREIEIGHDMFDAIGLKRFKDHAGKKNITWPDHIELEENPLRINGQK